MRLTSLRHKASLAMLAISLVAFFMVAIGWQAMRLSETTLSEFEAQTLPEISTALTLAVGVAQLAAIAPYTAESGRPFQLQTEAEKIQRRFSELMTVAENLADSAFRQDIFSRLGVLQNTLAELVTLVEEELFIREDSLALQFKIRALSADEPPLIIRPADGLNWLLDIIERPEYTPMAIIEQSALLTHPSVVVQTTAAELLQAHQRLAVIQQRKAYLIISVRAKSEQLSRQVSHFVGGLQKKVSNQRQSVADVVAYGQIWIVGISLFLLLGLTRLYLYSRDITNDLELVTHEMTQLAQGNTETTHPTTKRNDEIGKLAKAFDVFRQDALRRLALTGELSEQKELLETIFNSINDGLSVYSAEGCLMAWNPRYQDLFGLAPGQLKLGMPLAQVQQLIADKGYENRSLANEPIEMEEINRDRYLHGKSFERHFDSGKIVEFRSQPMPEGGFVTLYTDLTDRKSVEQQLRQAQKMEMLGQLTGGVAHDFNNLLAAIMGNLELLSDAGHYSAEQQKYIDRAISVSEKSRNLVQRLLAFSRRQQLFPEATHIDDLIEGMLDLVEYSVGNKIQVQHQLHCPQAYCLIDPSQLENALLNLTLNSAAAMPEGGDLSFSTTLCPLPDSSLMGVKIQVQDSGNGIAKELIPRIIEPFFTTKPIGKGSGLGLSMIYGFVKQSGGELVVESVPGQWTRVSLWLPLMATTEPPADREPLIATDKPHVDFHFPLRAGACVWLLEDDLQVADVLSDQLRQLGFLVECFEQAESVLARLLTEQPEVILSDVNLAGTLDGVTLAHQINTPIILMSALPKTQLQQKYGLLASDLFIEKPFNIKMLKEIFQAG